MSEVKRTLIEFVAIGIFCLVLGFVANSLNSYGLSLSKNYVGQKVKPSGNANTSEGVVDPIGSDFQIIQHEEMVKLFNDPLYTEGFYVIVDARKKELYEEGHIPGAYWFDSWRLDQYPESYLQGIIDICMAAGKVVCYCEGGDCEDSERAAEQLADFGVDMTVLYVYKNGYYSWIESGMPVETGGHNSGQIQGVR